MTIPFKIKESFFGWDISLALSEKNITYHIPFYAHTALNVYLRDMNQKKDIVSLKIENKEIAQQEMYYILFHGLDYLVKHHNVDIDAYVNSYQSEELTLKLFWSDARHTGYFFTLINGTGEVGLVILPQRHKDFDLIDDAYYSVLGLSPIERKSMQESWCTKEVISQNSHAKSLDWRHYILWRTLKPLLYQLAQLKIDRCEERYVTKTLQEWQQYQKKCADYGGFMTTSKEIFDDLLLKEEYNNDEIGLIL